MRLIESVKIIPPAELSAFRLVGLLQILPEADRLYTPVRKNARTESARVNDAMSTFGRDVVQALQRWVADEYAFWARCKRAAILGDWMVGNPIQTIEQKYSLPFGGQVQSGDIQRYADGTRFHLHSAHQILSALLAMNPEQEAEFDSVVTRLEFGLPADLAPMMKPPLLLSRGEYLALAERGICTPSALARADELTLKEVFGGRRAGLIASVCAALETSPISSFKST